MIVNAISIIGALCAVVLLSVLGFRGRTTRFFFIAALIVFALKCALGYWFWTRFIMSAGPDHVVLAYGDTVDTNEFYGMINALLEAHRYWWENGFTLTIPNDSISTNHVLPVLLQSLPLYFSNRGYPEITIPWNVFYSFITAYSVYFICRAENIGEGATRAVFLLALLNPFSLLPATAQKDILNQAAMAVSLHAISLGQRNKIAQVFIIIAAAFLMMNFRGPYFYIMALFGVYYFMRSGQIPIRPEVLMIGFSILLSLICATFVLGPGAREVFSVYFGSFLQRDGYNVFYNVPYGLLTPFPWSQPFELGVEGYIQIPRYPGVVLDNALLFCTLTMAARYRWGSGSAKLLPSTVFGVLFIGLGLLVGRTHYEYVHPSMIFLAPYVLREGWVRFRRALWISLGGMILLNCVWIVLTRVLAVKSGWTSF